MLQASLLTCVISLLLHFHVRNGKLITSISLFNLARFKHSANVIKAVVQGEDGDSIVKMIPKGPVRGPRKARTSLYNFDILDRYLEVPSTPPANIASVNDVGMKEKLEILRTQFALRPIWCRLALHNTTSIPYSELTNLLGHVSYTVHLGAFRDLWVRLGVDPRKDPSLYIYQLVFCQITY
jgi:hypothetical protein